MTTTMGSDAQPQSYFPRWKFKASGVIMPEERLSWGQTVVSGLQHCVAMSGATIIAPLLMGFDPNVAVLFSGVGTLIFFVIVAGRVPSYLGSSFAFIAVVIAATGYAGHGPNPNLSVALGGIIGAGVLYALIGYVWMRTRFDRLPGVYLHQDVVWLMIAWLFICMTGWVGPIANAAHVVGLIVGAIIAYGPIVWRKAQRSA